MNKEELKTLKDLIDYTEHDPVFGTINPNELKAEAVKWVKELENILDDEKNIILGKGEGKLKLSTGELWEADYESHDLTAVIIFLKHFFNLTEEGGNDD